MSFKLTNKLKQGKLNEDTVNWYQNIKIYNARISLALGSIRGLEGFRVNHSEMRLVEKTMLDR